MCKNISKEYSVLMSLAQLFCDTLAVILQKKNEIVEGIFSPAQEMQTYLISLKYQEIEVQQIQHPK